MLQLGVPAPKCDGYVPNQYTEFYSYSFLTAVSSWSSLGVYRHTLAALRYGRKAAMRMYIF